MQLRLNQIPRFLLDEAFINPGARSPRGDGVAIDVIVREQFRGMRGEEGKEREDRFPGTGLFRLICFNWLRL